MPFAQVGYPWAADSEAAFRLAFPADYICEAIDQTRGWFYSLMAVSTLVFDRNSYVNVLCLGHILAEDGKKMSKHLGNILEPIPLLERHGADAVRWFMLAGGSPWASRRVGHATIQETVRKVFLTFWNAVSFQALYARVNHWVPTATADEITRPVLDRWLLSVSQELIVEVTAALEAFDTLRAGNAIADFVELLSNWYIRRSRRRFWDGDDSALSTLHQTIEVVTRLMAPLAPFISERVWQDLVVPVDPAAPESVHLASWPTADLELIDAQLGQSMRLARRRVELGRSARAEAKVKIRQPLRRVLISSTALAQLGPELIDEIATQEEAIEKIRVDLGDPNIYIEDMIYQAESANLSIPLLGYASLTDAVRELLGIDNGDGMAPGQPGLETVSGLEGLDAGRLTGDVAAVLELTRQGDRIPIKYLYQ
jgi:isoleucyl-tRNA synthetase